MTIPNPLLETFIDIFRYHPFPHYYLEFDRTSHPVEFMIIRAGDELKDVADPRPYQDKFAQALPSQLFTNFINLSGDTHLVVPLPRQFRTNYANLATFSRTSDPETLRGFWMYAFKIIHRLNPTWVSTHGLGVSWLHLRLSSTPRYYHFYGMAEPSSSSRPPSPSSISRHPNR
jgi:hypothetical protein